MAPPFRVVEFDIMYGQGVSKTGELLDLGVQANIVEKSGAWFSYNGDRVGQGRENAKTYLRDHPEVADTIEQAIRANAGLVAEAMLPGPEADSSDLSAARNDVRARGLPAPRPGEGGPGPFVGPTP